MKIRFTDEGWHDYLYWQGQDRRTLRRINALIADLQRDPDGPGIGKPELLRSHLSGLRSRRIDETHRLVYTVEAGEIIILACRFHYE
ncbi:MULTISPECIES: Txe/YoeB family addiction module toxin [Dactylosporangium]|uniref:Endoribonuclease YoeB n=2 Tax=Dactylosporangium TaxID=35753 RepID=A0A9W6KK26_9ACTN|nr:MULTISPECIES: Txe/YoeB family addiction module toxin [Dactylosporangium]UAB98490.1 Txe/YoeB family addiction module toxin [Dactylosporangium vinaceum]UWZ46743.1 Txe/YoeB family addiction module toxin [Dactylosporangium matsuzakiense]GLL01701.1 hypothetical protein GCM10017581_034430 [Dactylosporangium matsuzakiense]